ncbi:MAG: tetratricopeptide repeat protein [Planctomycetota bacterium]
MDTERIPGKAITVAVVLVVLLAGVHLWWEEEEREENGAGGDMVIEETQLGVDGQQLRFETPDKSDNKARSEEAQQLLQILASDAPIQKRRSAALRLQYLADRTAEKPLLKSLKSEDEVIARRCSETLLELWQRSESPSVNRLMKQGMAAFEDGKYQEAMRRYDMCRELDPEVSDLYRLRAEILLFWGKTDEALHSVQKALDIQPKNFMAHYVCAQAHLSQQEGDKALSQVKQALDIYPGFEMAQDLKDKIISLQKAGEL